MIAVIQDEAFCQLVTRAANLLRNHFCVDEEHGVNEHKDVLRIAGDEPVTDLQFGAALLALKHAERQIRAHIDKPEKSTVPTELYEAEYQLVRETLMAVRVKIETFNSVL